MLKKRKIKAIYLKEAICDKCGSPMESTGIVLSTWPEQYPYKCTNKDCDGCETFWGHDRPGQLEYEFEEEEEDTKCITLLSYWEKLGLAKTAL